MSEASLWHNTAVLPTFPKLQKDCKTDVLIIGGGLAGVLTAYFLHQKGINYLLVEQGHIGSGVTGNTTAKITAQHGLIYHKIQNSYGTQGAQQYFAANQKAVEEYTRLCGTIACDFQTKDNFVYTVDAPHKLETELSALSKMGISAHYAKTLPLPMKTDGAVVFRNQAQFHPLKFLAAVANDLHIYENTKVLEMIGNTAITKEGTIKAKKVIVTTHFPIFNKHGSYFLKLYQHRSYVIALENAPNLQGMYVDDADTGFSFRNEGQYLLLGGGGHRTGKKGGNWQVLRHFAGSRYPTAKEVYHWATQDCMSLDRIPYIGQYSKATPDFYTATGLNKWGMTGAMVSAMILTDKIMGKRNEFEELFSPSRSMIKPQLLFNGWEATINLLTPTRRRCPHLGCALKWNPAEHSWDCPCHGSRFDSKGKVLDNPATGDIK